MIDENQTLWSFLRGTNIQRSARELKPSRFIFIFSLLDKLPSFHFTMRASMPLFLFSVQVEASDSDGGTENGRHDSRRPSPAGKWTHNASKSLFYSSTGWIYFTFVLLAYLAAYNDYREVTTL